MKTLTVVLVFLVFAVLLLHGVTGSNGSGTSKSGITKTTPIKPVKFCTPVIKSQTICGSRTKLFTRVLAVYLVTRYTLNKAPVYREGFPVNGRYVSIPKERAVRISSERVSLLNSDGNLCVKNSPVPRSLNDGIEKNLLELKTTVIYKTNPEKVTRLYGVHHIVSLEDIKGKTFTVTIRARYNVSVVKDTDVTPTDCTQVEKQVSGTMVDLYEFNPNVENKAGISTVGRIILYSIVGLFALVILGALFYNLSTIHVATYLFFCFDAKEY